ncbi:putative syntaxin 10 [Cavenderia fasciculata]|uniref:Syntaxin 10 n=1 Tax=Cavenderia fasciculata TaxID=261658 RepID=F4PQ72_CACFS|nr:putative syntaxin 10 [Cavenderia fasciculata]EGG22535.1 putative syntaxin 10 [Cavenderia fasciculata]|eukprot:XP_004360386.1 putative syntaxin 10 [Cavenderia fasciculata]
MSQDPFYMVQADVQSSLRLLTNDHTRWKQLLLETNTATNDEFKWTTKELKKRVRRHEETLRDLSNSNIVAEKFREKYLLTFDEIESRKRFVREANATLDIIKQDFNSPTTHQKIESDKQKELLYSEKRMNIEQDSRYSGLQRAVEEDNNDYLRDNMMMQQRYYEDQDQGLDILSQNVMELGEMTKVMETEIKSQGNILDRLGERAAKSQGALGSMMRRLDRFMTQTSSKVQWTLIAILGVIFLILVIISTTILKKK